MPPEGKKKSARGGKRPGAGRRKTTPLPKVRRDVAYEVIEILNGERDEKKATPEAQHCMSYLRAEEKRLSWDAYRYFKECVDGKPKQRVDPLAFDPNAPLRVLVEHIGRRA
jgi:hypothetical protein